MFFGINERKTIDRQEKMAKFASELSWGKCAQSVNIHISIYSQGHQLFRRGSCDVALCRLPMWK